eukprot:UN27367
MPNSNLFDNRFIHLRRRSRGASAEVFFGSYKKFDSTISASVGFLLINRFRVSSLNSFNIVIQQHGPSTLFVNTPTPSNIGTQILNIRYCGSLFLEFVNLSLNFRSKFLREVPLSVNLVYY